MIRVAILGAGIGQQHLRGYRSLPQRFAVTKMCDLDLRRAAEATGGDPQIELVGAITDVLSDASVDVVDVCLPPHLHAPVVMDVLASGKHAICEKPIARSLAEVDAMAVALAQSRGQIFPVFQYRYGHALSQLRALLEADLAGKALVASVETHWNRAHDYYAVPWRGTWTGEAGGAILGHAIHAHDLLTHFLGPVAEVSAYLDTRVNAIETEDCAAIGMRAESGALITSSVTLGGATDLTKIRLCFEGFTAESGTAPYSPAEDTWTFAARAPTRQVALDEVLRGVKAPLSGFSGFLEAIAEAIEGRPGAEVTFADGRRSIELVTALYKSARLGHPVRLPLAADDPFYHGWIPNMKGPEA